MAARTSGDKKRNSYMLRKHRQELFKIINSCYYCSKHINTEDKSIEHIIPVAANGSNLRQNLAVTHKSCNELINALGFKTFLFKLKHSKVISEERYELILQRRTWLLEYYKEVGRL